MSSLLVRAEKPKMGELQMDWLRSEDLKEEKNVTAPVFIVAGQPAIAFGSLAGKQLVGGSDSEPDLYCSARISLLAYPTHDLQKEALMGSRPFRENVLRTLQQASRFADRFICRRERQGRSRGVLRQAPHEFFEQSCGCDNCRLISTACVGHDAYLYTCRLVRDESWAKFGMPTSR